ncbi:phage protein Gp37 [Pseudomonas sp. GV071]|uniref:phage protein Gp37 n=1 Tax=Pseudomonas sp. GV071 TaxID=2135754 RepID=UPI000D33F924|nr:phage protein Gp37 [Pseudomonas sp. GV071]PTQ68143.1 uncharacterized protein DUF1834 [Pseudomonas sp. GV071]
MLGELEDLIQARLGLLRGSLKRLTIGSYGGELRDRDLLPALLSRCPAVLLETPRAVFHKRAKGRYSITISFRLVIASRHLRGEREGRRGNAEEIGSYALWSACMAQLVDWQPWPERARIEPTELLNLVNGQAQADSLSVLGQSFVIELDWQKPLEELPDLLGIDLQFHVPAGNPSAVANDSIELGTS